MRERKLQGAIGKDEDQYGRLHNEYLGRGSVNKALSPGVTTVEANLE